MKTTHGITLIGLGLTLAACGREAPLQTDAQMASYAVGLDIGRSMGPAASHVDVPAIARGISDAVAGKDPAIADSVMQAAMERFSETLRTAAEAETAALGTKNQEEGAAYLKENGAKPGVTTTASGLQYEVIQAGTGAKPGPNDMVTVHYKGTLIDGTEFDSSLGGTPREFSIAPGGVIQGFSEVLQLMPVGSKYRVVMPGNIAYGEMGAGGGVIGPNATLIFDIELISTKAP